MTTTPPATPSSSNQPIRAVFEVTLPDAVDCAVAETGSDAPSQPRTTTAGNRQTFQGYVMTPDGETAPCTEDVSEACVCHLVSQFECTFDLERVGDDTLVVSVVVDDRTRLTGILSTLETHGSTVELRRITTVDGDDSAEIDLTGITAKQREAIELAVELGYYDQPRGTDLEELADRLGISRSAVSQRLNAVESTLVRSVVTNSST
ncbi:helix-turn-helix domain-containing protein [Natrialbaceae archaeon AArc-T1-2]|uniref:helix-turn-helix domain-containing protein n=1 Tax=Natrialbaceae archaeon AArc-T1-2 TaxID=3053904 RepID=UPI00255B3DDC|nr:helix-turn-helix domain-containing protein [Natrialbaceae archaeon AArc-T1-2]WIV66660.1 helix-turn-helix domain-containing protein [Natrialbaceae archaeon AArc-T1-2]